MSDFLTGGHIVVRTLASLGIRRVFGVPGGQTLAITNAILDVPDVEFVTARHEGAAAVMADASGRLTGIPGVCLATTGPGATNLLTGVGGALRDSSPVLVITCNNHGVNIFKDDAQGADHVALFRPLTKSSRLVAHTEGIRQAIEEAYITAVSGNPGPVHLDFSRDAIENELADVALPPPQHPLLAWVRQRPRPAEDSLTSVTRRLAQAKRPALWLGNGCNRSGAGAAALALAELLDMPVITTFNGIGSVPTNHPQVFGALSRMGTTLSSRVVRESDLVIAVGNSLNAVSTGRWTLELPDIVQIDVDPAMIGRYYADRTFGLVGDARAVFEELLTAFRDPAGALGRAAAEAAEAADERAAWLRSLEEARQTWLDLAAENAHSADGKLSPPRIVLALRETAPDETLLLPDAGNPGVWSYLWEIRSIGSYLKPVGFGNMGFALPAAIAAASLAPDRPVLALIGDGSLGMSLAELETLSRVGGRVCVVVLNDDGYGNIRQEQVVKYGPRTVGVDFGATTDYAEVARGMGLRAERITSLPALIAGVGEALAGGDGPTLFDVPIDPEVNAWMFPPFLPYEPEDG